jgi:hypothetical protein
MRRSVRWLLIALVLVLSALAGWLVSAAQPYPAQTDPRSENARAFHVNGAGQVDGVELCYQELPGSKYQLVQARLIDEASAGGNTIARFAVVDRYGTPVSENVYLAWPWPALGDGRLLPGNQNSEHMVANSYSPPERGPLAIYVGDSQAHAISDLIGCLGLPFKRHVSYYLAFRERSGTAPATDTPTPPPVSPLPTPAPPGGDLAETNSLLQMILDALRQLNVHLGAAQ